ncbi:MAG: hypothetical protein JEZ02_18380 [Desulfatibacillum sp.]|nr:hypothetical protein [Desulfatibacillum sp.]
MLRFDVPFVPEKSYADFIHENSSRVYSLYFSLYSPHALDARHRFEAHEAKELAVLLGGISGVRKYALLNSRFNHPAWYFDPQASADVLETLQALLENQCLDGVIFGDFYQLQALSDSSPELCSALEAVPSINFMPDSLEKVRVLFSEISNTAFKLPEKIVLDRALNRNMTKLKRISAQIKELYPHTLIELLANEGCLYQCPYKPAHDALIAFCNMSQHPDNTHAINKSLGCMRHLEKWPHHLFASPLIRPEDANRYSHVADIIKLCGRNKGDGAFPAMVLGAYLSQSYSGNLLDLTDSMEWLGVKVDIPNQDLPGHFWQTLAYCNKDCLSCNYCQDLYQNFALEKEFALPDLRSPAGF